MNYQHIRLSRRSFLRINCAAVASLGLSQTLAIAQVQVSRKNTIGSFLDTLIPRDETPSATEAGILDDYLHWMDSDRYLSDISIPISDWLNAEAKVLNSYSFSHLSENNRVMLLQHLEQLPGDTIGRNFFDESRHKALELYYSLTQSWSGLQIRRPPQPLGYLSFHSALPSDTNGGG